MKLLKHKHFMSLIYSLLVALPFFAILGRVIYTQSNNNAKDNYSLSQSAYYTLSTESIINNGQLYNFITNDNQLQNRTLEYIYFTEIGIISDINLPINPYRFRLYYNPNNGIYSLQIDGDTTAYTTIKGSASAPLGYFTFNFIADDNYDISTSYKQFYLFNIDNKTKLDNAFEYSLSTFTKENNFGNLDFFSWFSDIFLDTSNTHNMLYINFVNWYLNYTLFISLAYVLFLVLMWFVSFVRRLLENTQNMNIGGL